MQSKPNDKKTVDQAVILNYIDKLVSKQHAVADAGSRFSLTAMVLSLLLLAISGGAAKAKGSMSLGGIGLKVSLAVLLTGVAVVIGVLVVAFLASLWQRQALTFEIQRLYMSTGFEDRTLYGEAITPFGGANITQLASTLFEYETFGDRFGGSRPVVWAALKTILVFAGNTIVPVSAQVGGGFKVAELLQSRGLGWTWIPFVLLALLTATTAGLAFEHTAVMGKRLLSEAQQESGNDSEGGAEKSSNKSAVVIVAAFIFVIAGAIGIFVSKVLGAL
jgi:hypothetical protein